MDDLRTTLRRLDDEDKKATEVPPLRERMQRFRDAKNQHLHPDDLAYYQNRGHQHHMQYLKRAFTQMTKDHGSQHRRDLARRVLDAQSSATSIINDITHGIVIDESTQLAIEELNSISLPSRESTRLRLLRSLLRADRKQGPLVTWADYMENPTPKRFTADMLRTIDRALPQLKRGTAYLFLRPFGRVTLSQKLVIKTFGPFMMILITDAATGLRDAIATFWPHHQARMTESSRGLWHPHINQRGAFCMGDANEIAYERIHVGQLAEYLLLAETALNIYSIEGGPERHIEDFLVRGQRGYCPLCERTQPITRSCPYCRKRACATCISSPLRACVMCGEYICDTCREGHPCEVRRRAEQARTARAERQNPDLTTAEQEALDRVIAELEQNGGDLDNAFDSVQAPETPVDPETPPTPTNTTGIDLGDGLTARHVGTDTWQVEPTVDFEDPVTEEEPPEVDDDEYEDDEYDEDPEDDEV
jgi:hypothetical protein